MSVLCKDVSSYSTCQRYRFPTGTLVWKVSQILYPVTSYRLHGSGKLGRACHVVWKPKHKIAEFVSQYYLLVQVQFTGDLLDHHNIQDMPQDING